MERIFSKKTLRDFWEQHPDSEQYLKTWFETVSDADWKNPHDVKNNFANASILKNNRIVFNVKGNTYKLIAKMNFEKSWVFIRFVGTHADYDRIDAENI